MSAKLPITIGIEAILGKHEDFVGVLYVKRMPMPDQLREQRMIKL